jgi:murein L,D-transpeptidase YcbB/YkuD
MQKGGTMRSMTFGGALMFSMLAGGATAASAAPADDSLHMTLNQPSYTLEVWDGSEQIRSYPVTIGMRDFQTPTGSFQISRVEWNPGWTPPDSKWAEGKKKAGPGPDSPMGRVKMQFDDYLYVHGTWLPKQIGGPHSHGCVRLRNKDALDLARLLATRAGVLTSAEITALEKNSRRTRSVRLPDPVPIRIRYDLTELVDGEVRTLKDPYHWASSTGTPVEATQANPATDAELGQPEGAIDRTQGIR